MCVCRGRPCYLSTKWLGHIISPSHFLLSCQYPLTWNQIANCNLNQRQQWPGAKKDFLTGAKMEASRSQGSCKVSHQQPEAGFCAVHSNTQIKNAGTGAWGHGSSAGKTAQAEDPGLTPAPTGQLRTTCHSSSRVCCPLLALGTRDTQAGKAFRHKKQKYF